MSRIDDTREFIPVRIQVFLENSIAVVVLVVAYLSGIWMDIVVKVVAISVADSHTVMIVVSLLFRCVAIAVVVLSVAYLFCSGIDSVVVIVAVVVV